MVSLNIGKQSSSNLALVRVTEQSEDSAKESTSMVVWADDDRILLAFSHWVLSLLMALGFFRISVPVFFKKSAAQYSTSLESKSSPPRCVSPAVAFTSNTPQSMVRRETSKVPPPKSKISTFLSPCPFLSSPQAIAAAVGSLMILRTFIPEIEPASLVACLWESLKQAGTVITAFFTGVPRQASAVSFILTKTMEEISSGKNFLVSPLNFTTIMGLSSAPASTVKGQSFMSFCTIGSWNFLPMSLLASQTVLVGFLATWFLAASPMSLSDSVNPTQDGVVLFPWSLAMISTLQFCQTPTQEQVVPRSIPTAFPCLAVICSEIIIVWVGSVHKQIILVRENSRE